ncbi:Tex family protein [Moraxella sp. ZY210820]|uniref:Tex family protein n=1 Tax=unclassified Moraxella TaxID=2685852 RepID=UPI00273220B8|nr:Tex family protein [Moraxella sp. ZY210820]WLF84001.1 RNA-binding transcriptional accessory protein [Moraxella sp. ZY210820]
MTDLTQQLAQELNIRQIQVQAAIELMDSGATIPFIARYRKEVTQGLDDIQLRQLESRLHYLRELNERRTVILQALQEQNKLSDDLLQRIENVQTKTELEDIYAPYKPKKTSRSAKAKQAGLGEFADKVLSEDIAPSTILADYQPEQFDNAYADINSQLDAIQHIIIDQWAEDVALTFELKQKFAKVAVLKSQLANEEKQQVGHKFRDYFEFSEPLHKVPSHRMLAILRGRQEDILNVKIDSEHDDCLDYIQQHFQLNQVKNSERQQFLQQTVRLFWLGKIRPQIETSLLTEKRLQAEQEAIAVFAENLRHLLLSAPAGGRCTLGVDPGIRTGVKLAVVNNAGDVLAHSTIYPFTPKNDTQGSIAELARLCQTYQIELIAIGNGTASRETEQLVADMMSQHSDLKLTKIVVSEAGASVYSASELASQELPDLDVSIRGAVSIARRLQDPLAELVKIDPKSIGVGQYQHDVNQTDLAKALDAVVEDCVNAVGVDVNTASPAILAYIAGLNKNVAQQIVEYRKTYGIFKNRQQLKKVPRLGDKTFEQAAGFLRIQQGDQPLDASAVHPESYILVEKIAKTQQVNVQDMIANSDIIRQIKAEQFVDEQFGLLTVQDVLAELEKPARDPRPEFKTAQFRADITELSQLVEGMQLEGIITNVTNFGAFVDIGVHQDCLVHISELADQFVSDPHQVVKAGQIVQVKVLTVDIERKRVNLTMRTQQKGVKSSSTVNAKTAKKMPTDKAKKSAKNEQKIGGLGALLLQAGVKK